MLVTRSVWRFELPHPPSTMSQHGLSQRQCRHSDISAGRSHVHPRYRASYWGR